MKSWHAAEVEFDSATFSGVARLFPLPNLVLYPHVMQPLHIFEERYREMLEDALAGDRLIAMAVLEPGWEDDYDSRPPIAPYACLGKVVAHHRLDDGHYNVLLLGVERVRIIQELDPLRSFRQAKVEIIEDRYDFSSKAAMKQMQERLLAAFQKHLPCTCQLPEQLEEMLSQHMPLGLLTDLAAYALPLDAEVKRRLLGERRVSIRAETILEQVTAFAASTTATAPSHPFPPLFSAN
jgi:ATP-dependent Lon protease